MPTNDTNKKIHVLYIDDEENNLFSFRATFRLKYQIYTKSNPLEALDFIKNNPQIEIIITDQRMPVMSGVELLQKVLEINPNPIRIVLTGFADMNDTIDMVNKGKIYHYLQKPWKEEEVDQIIHSGYEYYIEKMIALEKAKRTEEAEKTADKIEFLLRQKLLS